MKRKLCDIDEIIEKQAKEFETMLGKKRIQLIRENLGKELKVWADENKITQVINNLLGNAVKYTPEEGKIGIKVVPAGESVRLEFEDTGKSIPSDKLEKIFDEFERAGAEKEGEGLGLAITKDIIELHEGKIWAESQPDKGNKFVVVLPRDLRGEDR
jgi:two-component system sensor histidine kinase VicK